MNTLELPDVTGVLFGWLGVIGQTCVSPATAAGMPSM
jgi:hypothetical protein